MGLLSELLKLPAAPIRGPLWVLRQVAEQAEREYSDPAVVQRELSALAERLDAGEIGQDEFDRREDELLSRLEQPSTRYLDDTGRTQP
ncbi:gas vesicle protein GvpG [Streptomyces sp. 184]|uniref:gas vesicle protein GvpG n=1 Tax=Streptomyces sp. 184 TaxID=1827526 RepID=UPI0038928EB7